MNELLKSIEIMETKNKKKKKLSVIVEDAVKLEKIENVEGLAGGSIPFSFDDPTDPYGPSGLTRGRPVSVKES